MSDLREEFKVGQRVTFVDDSFDAVNNAPCIVQSVDEDSMVLMDMRTATPLYVSPMFNLHCVMK